MEIEVLRSQKNFAFTASNGEVSIPLCAAPSLEAGNSGFRPMQLVLVGLAGCLSIDVLNILYKQKQSITAYRAVAKATRSNATPSTFEEIHLELELSGSVDPDKVQKAINLSAEKYCSVHKILEQTARIQCSFKIL